MAAVSSLSAIRSCSRTQAERFRLGLPRTPAELVAFFRSA
jgi:hypothetical protein